MRSKASYKLIGMDPPTPPTPTVGFMGLSAGFRVFFGVFVALTAVGLVAFTIVVPVTTTARITDVGNLRSSLVTVNETLCAKILDVNTTLFEIAAATNATAILESFDTALSEAIASTNFTQINSELQVLTQQVAGALVTLNNVTGSPLGPENLLNIQLVAAGLPAGLEVDSDQMTHEIRFKNTGVVTVNAVPSLVGSSDLLVTGVGMITINSLPLLSTIEVDGTALSVALSNLQMQTNMQQMEIVTLQTNITNIQTQITNIQMVGDMIAQDLNGTTLTFNMTMMQLVMDVMTLQTTIISLQSQIAALNVSSVPPVPTGTIAPFGGTVIPDGYLLCDGTQHFTSAYPDLYNVIGTMYCPGPCIVGVFALPDLRGKVPAGQGGTALSGTIGSTVGAETHTLSSAEMPVHTHTGATDVQGSHSHNVNFLVSQTANFPQFYQYQGMGPTQAASYTTTVDGAHAHNLNINAAGSGAAHNNIQPSLIIKYIIKT